MDGYLLRTRLTALPTADSFRRGQFILLENPGVSDDKLYYGIQETAGSYVLKEIPFGPITIPTLTVQVGDVTVDSTVTTLDFSQAFTITESPEDEINIAANFGTLAGMIAEGNHTHATVPVGGSLTFQAFDNTGASTASTLNYSTACSKTFTLPTGTWTLEVNAWGRIGHTAPGTMDLRLVIDGTNGSAINLSGPATGAYPGAAGGSKVSVASGSRTVSAQLRASTAGTAVWTNVSLIITATRTA